MSKNSKQRNSRSIFTQELMCALPILCLLPLMLYPPERWDLSLDPDGVTFGQRSVPSSSGHERLVHLQRHPGRGQRRQPGVSGEVRLQEQQLPEESVRPAGSAGTAWKVMEVLPLPLHLVHTRCGTPLNKPPRILKCVSNTGCDQSLSSFGPPGHSLARIPILGCP